MRKIQRSDIASMHKSGAIAFEELLMTGLVGLFEEDKGVAGFGEIAQFIGNDQSLSHDLQDVFECLDFVDRSDFQSGLANALANAVNLKSETFLSVAICLIKLSGYVQAHQVLRVLPAVLRQKAVDLSREQLQLILEVSYSALPAVATLTGMAAKCIYQLIEIGRPMPALAFPAFFALASADCENVDKHLSLLWPELDAILGWHDTDVENVEEVENALTAEREQFVRAVFDIVGPEAMLETLSPEPRLRFIQAKIPNDWMEEYDWWIATLRSQAPEIVEIVKDMIYSTKVMQMYDEDEFEIPEIPEDVFYPIGYPNGHYRGEVEDSRVTLPPYLAAAKLLEFAENG